MSELKNKSFDLEFNGINDDGMGVSKIDGKVVFVPYVIDGEKAKIKIVSDKKSFCYGKLESLEKESINRRIPECPYFYKCGGCDLQHIKRNYQLDFKTKKVKDIFKKFAGQDVLVLNCIGGQEFRYRNKVSLPVDKNGKVGIYRKNSHDIIEVEDCLISKPWVKDLISATNDFIKKYNVSCYDESINRGILRHVVAREIKNRVLITLVVNTKKFIEVDKFLEILKTKFKNFSLNININTKPGNVILGDKWIDVYGQSSIESEILGIKYSVSNASFFQVNDEIRDLAYKEILNNIDSEDTVIDAYSGAGLLTALISKKAKNAIGVEIIKEATEDANKLKLLNHLDNMENINGDCAKILPDLIKKIKDSNFSIVLDPPRKGVDENIINAILSTKPKKIIYLSCNPVTLARDAKLLLGGGYKILKLQPYDMFPNTSHVETLLVLVKNQK